MPETKQQSTELVEASGSVSKVKTIASAKKVMVSVCFGELQGADRLLKKKAKPSAESYAALMEQLNEVTKEKYRHLVKKRCFPL